MRLFIGVLTLLPLLAAAETAYVTDNLRLNMYQNADLSGTRVDTLVSGQAFELANMRQSFAEPAALVERLQQESADLQARIDSNAARMLELDEENQAHIKRAATYRYSLPYSWVSGAIIVCLIAGFLLGLWWVDRESRKRHGGIRIY